jgi:hypothetical protein
MELQPMLQILEIINAIFLAALLWLTWKFLFKKNFVQTTSSTRMITWSIAGSLAVFLTLAFLSFTYEVQKGYFNNWNYISEARYFAFVIVFLQLLFLGWVFLSGPKEKAIFQKIILYSFSFLLFIEITHNLYFHTRVVLQFNKYKNEVYREQDYNYFNSLLFDLKRNNPDSDILTAASGDDYYPCTAVYYGGKGIFDPLSLVQKLPSVRKESFLIIMIYDPHLENFKPLLSNPGIRKLQRVGNSNFYLLKLNPS